MLRLNVQGKKEEKNEIRIGRGILAFYLYLKSWNKMVLDIIFERGIINIRDINRVIIRSRCKRWGKTV